MTEYTSIRVTVDAKDAAEESKRDGETWNDYLQRCTENPPEVREYVEAAEAGMDPDVVAASIAASIDIGDVIDARIVDIDAAERRKFAEEVAGVLRE